MHLSIVKITFKRFQEVVEKHKCLSLREKRVDSMKENKLSG